jgi:hypothetical protein
MEVLMPEKATAAGKHAAAEPEAGLVEKGAEYPKTKADLAFSRQYRVQALPPDTWELQKDTVLAQAAMDAENEGIDVGDLEVTGVEADEPNGVVFVTVEG